MSARRPPVCAPSGDAPPGRVLRLPEWRTTARQAAAIPSDDAARALMVFDAAQIASGFVLEPATLVVGRSSRCEVWLQDPGVSRRHCQLRVDPRSVWLKDLDSTNGTFVNGQRVEARELAPGDVVCVGASRLTLVRRDSPEWQAHRVLSEQAYGDELTGLLNRRGFRLRVDAAFASRNAGAQVSLVVVDADHFKQINDGHGHATGDEVIRHIGLTIQALLPEGCFAARVGGEEFAMLLPQRSLGAVRSLAEALRQRIASRPPLTRRGAIALTVSIGIAHGAADAGARALFAQADAALYRAKSAGRNRVSE